MAEITIDDLTTKEIKGSGVFDELMASLDTRMNDQYSKGRLKGTDYSKVYLGGMEAAMQQSIVFLLGRQKADKEADLIDENIEKSKTENLILLKELEKMDSEICILEEQCKNETKKGLILDEEVLKIKAETELVEEKVINEGKQGLILDKELLKMDAEIAYLNAQAENMYEQYLLTKEEIDKVKAETQVLLVTDEKVEAETSLINANKTNATKEGLILDINKVHALIQSHDMAVEVAAKAAQGYDYFYFVDPVTGIYAPEIGEPTLVTGILGNQILKLKEETKLIGQKASNALTEGEILEGESTKLIYEARMLSNQGTAEEAKYRDNVDYFKWSAGGIPTIVSGAPVAGTMGKQNSLVDSQGGKVQAEWGLVVAKQLTESAQFGNELIYYNQVTGAWQTYKTTTQGVIGDQKALLKRQVEGFGDKVENDQRQTDADIYGVGKAVDGAYPHPSWYKYTNTTPG